MSALPVPVEELNLLHSHICQALSDPTRLQILYALYQQPLHVSALAEALGLPQPTVSRHLSMLRQRALVLTVREGNTVVYSLADPRLIDVVDIMRQVLRDALERQASMLE